MYNNDGTYKRISRLSTPKSTASLKTIPIVDNYVPVLKQHIETQKELYFRLEKKWNDNALLFLNHNINFLNPKNFRTVGERFLKRCGIKK